MIIGARETFVGVKVNSVISSEDFVHYEMQDAVYVPSFYSYDCASEIKAQAP